MNCRGCQNKNIQLVHDFGRQPIANRLLNSQDEPYEKFPLEFYRCDNCGLFQVLNVLERQKIFDDQYPYLSGTNQEWVKEHQDFYREYLKDQNAESICEIGSNDGSILEVFKEKMHIGFEPSKIPYEISIMKGLNVHQSFFAGFGVRHDLIIANNVLAHNHELSETLTAIKKSLSEHGTLIIEQPDSNLMIQDCQWDQIYHEHFSYFDLYSMNYLLNVHGLTIDKIQFLDYHGGSIRYFVKHTKVQTRLIFPEYNLKQFSQRIIRDRDFWKEKFQEWKWEKKEIYAYGAAAKGTAFLNYCGITSENISYCIDETECKWGKFIPGTRIPIKSPSKLHNDYQHEPDMVFILPWNFKKEMAEKLRERGFRGEIFCRYSSLMELRK